MLPFNRNLLVYFCLNAFEIGSIKNQTFEVNALNMKKEIAIF